MKTREGTNTYRITARVVGVIYLAGFVIGLAGTGLIQSILGAPHYLSTVSANSTLLASGALLWLLASIGDASHGILLFPVLKRQSERMALGYLAARIADAVFLAIYVLFILVQIPLGSAYLTAAAPGTFSLQALSTMSTQANLYAYDIGMIALALAGLTLNLTFYRAKLVPRWIAIWGILGYAILFCGTVSVVMGSGLSLVSSLPGGLWEVFIGVWLIVRGFNASAFVPQTTGSSNLAELEAASS